MKRSLITIGTAVLAAATISGTAFSQTVAERRVIEEIDRFADSVIKSVPVAGLAITISRGEKTILSKGYGLADVQTGRRMTDSTASRIGSITKVFTSVGIMKLVDKGLVDLDADIRTYLPELTLPPVTVRQALNHTSGLPDYEGPAIARWQAERKPITKEFVTGILATQKANPAGINWIYNNAGFYLLGLIIEKVSGKTYEEFIEYEINRPLGLNQTWMPGRAPRGAVETRNYYLEDGKLVPDSLWDLPGIWAGGGMLSTTTDLMWFMKTLGAGDLMSKPAFEDMLEPTVLPSGARADYGLGIRLGDIAGHPKLGHTGSARSTRAAAAYYPKDSLTVVVLMNTENESIPISAIEIEGRVARTLLGVKSTRRTDLKISPAAASAYTGIYTDGTAQTLIGEKEGVLQFSRVGSTGAPIPLLYQGGDTWADPEYAEYFFVFQKQDSKAIALARYDNGWFVGVRSRTEPDGAR